MEKVPFIYQQPVFGTGAIKALQCYLSLQKGFVRHRAEGERGKEEAGGGAGNWQKQKVKQSSFIFPCLSLSFILPQMPSQFTCCGELRRCRPKAMSLASFKRQHIVSTAKQ